MKKKCECGGKYDYSMSEVHLIPNTDPQEAGIEGMCDKCMSHVYIKFRAYQTEVTKFDDFMNDENKDVQEVEPSKIDPIKKDEGLFRVPKTFVL